MNDRPRSTTSRLVWISLLISAVVFLIFTWPLAPHIHEAIPASSQNQEQGAVLDMLPGDHLQLLYHFWLFRDFAEGSTPWFHDLYEFNLGDDDARFWPRAYYFPISGIFAICSWIGGLAFGYNATIFVCIWLTYLFTCLLLRRLGLPPLLVATASLLAIVFPYRWVAVLGGAPAGFAAMYIPLLWWSLDALIHEPKKRYMWIHAAAWIGLGFGDFQTLYFTSMLIPAMLLCAWSRPGARARPLPLCIAAAGWAAGIGYTRLMLHLVPSSSLDEGRPEIDIALGSPSGSDLIAWFRVDTAAHGYVGLILLTCIVLGLIVTWRRLAGFRLLASLLTLGLGLGILVALGTNGPLLWQGEFESIRPIHIARKLVPYFDHIRQPTKLYIVFPILLAVLGGLIARHLPQRIALLLLGCVVFESSLQVRTSLCRLEDEPAYALAKELAGDKPVLVLPLHPGDDAGTSSAIYHAMRNRLRLVNGYSPVIPETWQREAYEPVVRNVAAGEVIEMKGLPEYILLHETLVRHGTDPYPGSWLRSIMTEDCRLSPIAWTNGVGLYQVYDRMSPPAHGDLPHALPGCEIEVEAQLSHEGSVYLRNEAAASAGRFMDMAEPGTWLELPEQRGVLHVRLRGSGRWTLDTRKAPGAPWQPGPETHQLDAGSNWIWQVASMREPGTHRLRLIDGDLDLDSLLIMPRAWDGATEVLEWKAMSWFHRGIYEPQSGALILEPGNVTTVYDAISGPFLPLPPGRYRFEVSYKSNAPTGAVLGEWRFQTGPEPEQAWSFIAGKPPSTPIEIRDNRPFEARFTFSGQARLDLFHFELIPLPEKPD